jgi:hypothetical protein
MLHIKQRGGACKCGTWAAARVEGGNLESTESAATMGDIRGFEALSSSLGPRYADKHIQTVS